MSSKNLKDDNRESLVSELVPNTYFPWDDILKAPITAWETNLTNRIRDREKDIANKTVKYAVMCARKNYPNDWTFDDNEPHENRESAENKIERLKIDKDMTKYIYKIAEITWED